MPGPSCRKFGLLDAMILVASAAVGALSIRQFTRYGWGMMDLYRGDVSFPTEFRPTLYPDVAVKCVLPWLASFTAALLVIGLRPPRPGFTRLARQPGMAACLAAVSTMAVGGLLAALAIAVMGVTPSGEQFYYNVFIPVIEPAGLAVAAVWLVMALGGRWRAQPGWIDRTGRALGGCWTLVFLLSTWVMYWFSATDFRYHPPSLPLQKMEDRAFMKEHRKMDRELQIELNKVDEVLDKALDDLKSRDNQ